MEAPFTCTLYKLSVVSYLSPGEFQETSLLTSLLPDFLRRHPNGSNPTSRGKSCLVCEVLTFAGICEKRQADI
jgi:hypothetical protein